VDHKTSGTENETRKFYADNSHSGQKKQGLGCMEGCCPDFMTSNPEGVTHNVPVFPLSDVFHAYSLPTNKTLGWGLLSFDVEGAEDKVMGTVPWKTTRVDFVNFEQTLISESKLKKWKTFFTARGLVKVVNVSEGEDILLRRPSVTFHI